MKIPQKEFDTWVVRVVVNGEETSFVKIKKKSGQGVWVGGGGG